MQLHKKHWDVWSSVEVMANVQMVLGCLPRRTMAGVFVVESRKWCRAWTAGHPVIAAVSARFLLGRV